MPSSVLLPTLELIEFEKVVPRGVSKQTWAVRLNDRWFQAVQVPGAVVVGSPSRSGVVWERRVQLALAPGTSVRLTAENPQRAQRKDVFSVMTVDPHATTRCQRVEYIVTATGILKRRGK